MDAHQIGMMATYARPAHFAAGEIIFRTGELANRFYLIESGTVVIEGKVFDEPSVIIDTLSTGDALGWSWLFPPYLWHFDARAKEPTVALSFDTATLRQHYEEDLTLAHELFRRMSEVMVRRLQTARRKLIEGTQKSPDQEG
jgi:CRP/FNR family transcriptional regulator, cyclic AMP receptor protein